MTDSREVPGATGPHPTNGAGPSLGRRRLLQAGISATPIIMTVASRPVMAGGVPGPCLAPSGFLSGNLSHPGGGICGGRTPGYWKQQQHFDDWRSPYYPTTVTGPGAHDATFFKDVFSPDLFPVNLTFLCVLEPGCGGAPSGPPFNVARHLVAAVLNAAAGYVPATILPVTTIQEIWNEFATTGLYMGWNDEQIIAYLLTTMPV